VSRAVFCSQQDGGCRPTERNTPHSLWSSYLLAHLCNLHSQNLKELKLAEIALREAQENRKKDLAFSYGYDFLESGSFWDEDQWSKRQYYGLEKYLSYNRDCAEAS